MIAASLYRPSGLSQEATTKSITLWVEPIRQRLFGIYTVLSLIYVAHYTAIAQPCLNTKQAAAELDRKGQHALIIAQLVLLFVKLLKFVKLLTKMLNMAFHHFSFRHPLVYLQIAGWAAYIFIDILAHHRVGYFIYSQSIAYGVAAFILTSCVALLSQKNKSTNIIFQSLYFIFLLYIAAVIWHKLYVVIHFQMDQSLSVKVSQLFKHSLLEWTDTGYMPLFLFFAWGGLYVAAKWYITHQNHQNELNRAFLNARQAQLLTLRYQLNPHFLFNVLNSIDVSVLNNDKATAHNMLKYLSNFLRSTLEEGESDKVTLEKEFELIRNFTSIEQLRFGDSLDLQMELPDNCRRALIPTMLLQPLVENAIKYAWSQKETGRVSITASKQANSINITIRNNKTTVEPKLGTGTGLKNTRERLHLIYGADASIAINELSHNFEVVVKFPLEEQL